MRASQLTLAERVEALGRAAEQAAGRSDPEVVEFARDVVRRAGERLAFSGEFTVVALAGATGSGKSSLFNAITATDLAEIAVRRPTTSRAMAVAWGTTLPHELLEWLDVPRRHLIAAPDDDPLARLVLIDLPDHDSTQVTHRLAVDRLVRLVDGLIWVVDPQKYADAALHENYLKPLAPYAELMMVILNQADRLAQDDLARCVTDLRRLLDSEGLRKTPVMVTSALRGTGIPELRTMLQRTVSGKHAALRRLGTDVEVAAQRLADDLGDAKVADLGKGLPDRLTAALGDAAGVPTVVDGVYKAWRKRGAAATGWPFVSWIGKLKPDPLKRLRLDLGGDHSPVSLNRTSLPKAGPVQHALVERALRGVTDAAADGLPRGWADAVRKAARSNQAHLPDSLDAAIAGTDLGARRGTWWWQLFRVLQWLLMLAVVAGGLWELYVVFHGSLQLPALPEVVWYQVAAQWWLLGGGVIGGLLLAVLGRGFVAVGAGSRARAAQKALRASIAEVTTEQVIAPVAAELDRYTAAVAAVAAARRGR